MSLPMGLEESLLARPVRKSAGNRMPYALPLLLGAVDRVATQRKFVLMRRVLSNSEQDSKYAVLRFDVERDIEHHLKVATELSQRGVFASMYFHTRRATYHPDFMKRIADLGHEVGYHHECLDRCGGDRAQARELFLREVEMFRRDGLDLRTATAHGESGLRKIGYRLNSDLFDTYPTLLEEAGLLGEVYQWLKSRSPWYASDTFVHYSRFWEILNENQTDLTRPMMILAHPHRWHDNTLNSWWEIGQDVWQAVRNRVRGRRSYDLA
jgi:hypothetical protein